jgi:hypothetical protein
MAIDQQLFCVCIHRIANTFPILTHIREIKIVRKNFEAASEGQSASSLGATNTRNLSRKGNYKPRRVLQPNPGEITAEASDFLLTDNRTSLSMIYTTMSFP